MAMTNSVSTYVTVNEPAKVTAEVRRSSQPEQGLTVTIRIGDTLVSAYEYPGLDYGVTPEAFADMLVRLVALIRLEAVTLRAELADALP